MGRKGRENKAKVPVTPDRKAVTFGDAGENSYGKKHKETKAPPAESAHAHWVAVGE
jgi:hypothetical protein